MDRANSSPIRNQKYAILAEIKRSDGLSVGELAERMNLSYMGVKQHCNSLEQEGYLSTQRRAKRVGRPEKLYVLTGKANEFFPQKGPPFVLELLESIDEIYGSLAADRILHRLYRRYTEALRPLISGSALAERARQLAQAREKEGYMSRYEPSGAPHGQVLEFHSPIQAILDRFPQAREFERLLFERLLATRVERSEDRSGGGCKIAFLLLDSEEREPKGAAGSFLESPAEPKRTVVSLPISSLAAERDR
ncbi:MAG: MarR family transcriptional regulator [Methylacidiphilaceae bacterium]|nr:MarR family transcriptional regulator [Candidatus Methylacidiphilaceae bacterium]